jgi:putative two-component system response regulator
LEKRILIVDDEQAICTIIAQRLRKKGCSCVTAHSGKEALHHLYRNKFPLVISDINMPEMNGIKLLKQVKRLDPHIMVIIVTAFPEIAVAREAIRLGAYDFIVKPIDLDLMVFSVEKAFEKKKLEEEVETYHQFLENLAEAKTTELQSALLILKKTHLDSVKVLAGAIEAKDPYTRGHSDRVRSLSLRIGIKLGLSGKRLEDLVFGALLHDIGKIGIKDEVLQKPGQLSPEEYRHVQEHPLIGVKILETFDFFKDKVLMIRHHHEHFDGGGYPDRLVGDKIPLEARIIAITDAFDAMTSLRPHRAKMALATALNELQEGVGKQFDPSILEIFLREKLYDSPLDYSPRNNALNLAPVHQILSLDHYADNLSMLSNHNQ